MIALLLPSFGSKYLWILEKFRVVVISHRLGEDGCSFRNGQIANKVVFLSLTNKDSVSWPVKSQILFDSHF